MKSVLSIIILLSIPQLNIQGQNISENFYKRLTGKIDNKYAITFNLIKIDTSLSGNYYYDDKGIPINLGYNSSMKDDGSFYIEEYAGEVNENYEYEVTGMFNGQLKDNTAEGYWQKPGSLKKLRFNLTEEYPAGSCSLSLKKYKEELDSIADFDAYILEIEGDNKELNEKINHQISSMMLEDSISQSSINDKIDAFFERTMEINEDFPIHPSQGMVFFIYISSAVYYNSDNILSIEISEMNFEGGAHQNTFISTASFNLKTGDVIHLSDMFKQGSETKLADAGERILRRNYNLKETESLENAGFYFENNKFYLTDNYYFTKGGVVFQYNAYEIAPYVMGAPKIFIPYSEIKDLMK